MIEKRNKNKVVLVVANTTEEHQSVIKEHDCYPASKFPECTEVFVGVLGQTKRRKHGQRLDITANEGSVVSAS